MREQPTGEVTFVFTDIEGSTRLLLELGAKAYREALAKHRRVVREAFATGYEVDEEGDAFFYAFPTAGSAVTAVEKCMRGLHGGAVRIRVGIHTGEPVLDPPKYVGLDVHRAARVMAAGHGDQVLLTESTRALLEEGVAVRDLGEHRLKDLPEPLRLFQLSAAGLRNDFPPLRSLNNTNLPRPGFSLVGRDRELHAVHVLIAGERCGLVTVTGAGGTGKTRLALEAARQLVEEFADGVFFVPLASVPHSDRVIDAILDVLPLRERGDAAPLELAADYLESRRILLVVDNFEHVVDAAPAIGALLRQAPDLAVLATSREPLRIEGEREFPLEPLEDDAAFEVFVQRVRVTLPGFDGEEARDEIAAACRRVDGLPLGIELAAARIKLLGVSGLVAALDRRLDILKTDRRDVHARQQTLRATIEWSFDLLAAREQELLTSLSVFAEGCTLEAAAAVCEAELDEIASLMDKSLVRGREEDGEVRFWLLQTVRDFCREYLGAGLRALQDRHLNYFASFAEEARPRLWDGDQMRWLRRLDHERENFRAALVHGFINGGDIAASARLAAALQDYWDMRGLHREGSDWLGQALAAGDDIEPLTRATVCTGAALLIGRQGKKEDLIALTTVAAELFHAHGDPRGETRALGMLAQFLVADPDPAVRDKGRAAARRVFAAAEEAGDGVSHALAAACRAEVTELLSGPADARPYFDETARLFSANGDRRNAAIAMLNSGMQSVALGDAQAAEKLLSDAIDLAREFDDPLLLSACLATLAEARVGVGNWLAAIDPLAEALQLARRCGTVASTPNAVLLAAALSDRLGDDERTRRLLQGWELYYGTRPTTQAEQELLRQIAASLGNSREAGIEITEQSTCDDAIAAVDAARDAPWLASVVGFDPP